jgi:hypothetical protein
MVWSMTWCAPKRLLALVPPPPSPAEVEGMIAQAWYLQTLDLTHGYKFFGASGTLKVLSNKFKEGLRKSSNNLCWQTGGLPVFLFEF